MKCHGVCYFAEDILLFDENKEEIVRKVES